ncbi:DNA primase [archaeon]|jgi:DNA primase|nr:DNA primase [archaeon]MBT4022810.1 DNA primase [archaeon]MBT4272996.1 DNA primase [archaeon]MBT4460913.1 DNA primase [archaeon]MBT4858129.1 DNA primase [archaeon]
MGKISPISAKYIIHANIDIEGVVDRPDVIGAVFGQTEGLLGSDLELRELQRSGRIGRIEVQTETKLGKTTGTITIPSSLDKAETAIVGAALEIIQRIGPCNAKIVVQKIEDIRISKRNQVIERAKYLLKRLMEDVMPDSQEISDEVAYSVRVMEIQEFGRSRLPAGPAVDESEEVIVVEGRADVLNLLKHGFKNVIAMNGTSVPPEIVELGNQKILTIFVDGDRGGTLIVQELMGVTEVDYVAKAPDGKEVEEITKKEIHKAIRSRISAEQVKLDAKEGRKTSSSRSSSRTERKPVEKKVVKEITDEEKSAFNDMLEDLIGTRGAYVLDDGLNILGKVPISELQSTLNSLNTGVHAVIFDGIIDKDLVAVAEKANVAFLIGMDNKVKSKSSSVVQMTVDDF